jgi:hypothetical protein
MTLAYLAVVGDGDRDNEAMTARTEGGHLVRVRLGQVYTVIEVSRAALVKSPKHAQWPEVEDHLLLLHVEVWSSHVCILGLANWSSDTLQVVNGRPYGVLHMKNRVCTVWDGRLHSHEDAPAVVITAEEGWCHGDGLVHVHSGREWYKSGLRHRDGDRPAIEYVNGRQEWFREGKRHRDEDKPAVIHADGSAEWFCEGECHRDDDKPAVMNADGSCEWYKRGRRHRDADKPACVYASGTQWWYRDGFIHRDRNQPALVRVDGKKKWYRHGQLCTSAEGSGTGSNTGSGSGTGPLCKNHFI